MPVLTGTLPPTARESLVPASGLASAEAITRHLAHSHYENFSVVSLLLPRRLRQDFCNVYAFCRVADDLGDEVGDRAASLRLLHWLAELTRAHYTDQDPGAVPNTALFLALAGTIR